MHLRSVGIISSVKVEQRANVKFLVKLGKTATKTYDLLRIFYDDDSSSRTQVFEWFKRFKEGMEVIEDGLHPGRPRTLKTDGNVEKIREII